MDSILTSIKKLLGIDEECIQFDTDIIIDINTVFMSINQLGIGPSAGFTICDKTKIWKDLLGNRTDVEAIKTYTYLKVKLMFDPPSTGYVLDAIERQIHELEWRINIQAESVTVV